MSDKEQSTQPTEIYSRLGRIMEEVEPIAKGQTNRDQNFKFRGIEDVMNSLHALFKKHGVFVSTEIINHEVEEVVSRSGSKGYHHQSRVAFDLVTIDGSKHRIITLGESIDYGDKGATKTLSVALKYALCNFFLIPTAEMSAEDPDRNAHEVRQSQPEAPKLPQKWTEWKVPFPKSKRHGQDLAEIVMEGDTVEDLLKMRKFIKDLAKKKEGKPDYDYWCGVAEFVSEAIEAARNSPDGERIEETTVSKPDPNTGEVAHEDVFF